MGLSKECAVLFTGVPNCSKDTSLVAGRQVHPWETEVSARLDLLVGCKMATMGELFAFGKTFVLFLFVTFTRVVNIVRDPR